ncbi:MAG: CvpA family protein [Bacteroidales bacterium]|nr:CvpA family protein [Candidatus Colimorpha onthohippi]
MIDIIIALPLIYFCIKGFCRGIIFEITMLLGIIVGTFAAIHFSKCAANWLSINSEGAILVVFFGIFLLAIVASFFIGRIAAKIIKTLKLGIINRMLGALTGMIKGICIVSIIINTVLIIDHYELFLTKSTKEHSVLIYPTQTVGNILTGKLKTFVIEHREEITKQHPQ